MRLIIGQRIGRLGNQIYLLAHLLALHQASGIGFAHPTLGEYGKFFEGTSSDFFARYPAGKSFPLLNLLPRSFCYLAVRLLDKIGLIGRHGRKNSLRVDYRQEVDLSDPDFLKQAAGHSYFWLLGGWRFRYPTITKDFFSAARAFFALTEPYASNVERLVQMARDGADILVGVHIRQTDFKEHSGGKFYFTTSQYFQVLLRTNRLLSGRCVNFLVVSDEPKSSADFPSLKCIFGTGVPIEDMYALGGCDYIISSTASSFSLWPSVLYQIPNYRLADPATDFSMDDFRVTTAPWTVASEKPGEAEVIFQNPQADHS
jgi:hypothetical protein